MAADRTAFRRIGFTLALQSQLQSPALPIDELRDVTDHVLQQHQAEERVAGGARTIEDGDERVLHWRQLEAMVWEKKATR